ncbi:MAG: DUF2946 family protein [Victivallales bacterium]|nr:DUF2946 family protein [Victivallales bacterium]
MSAATKHSRMRSRSGIALLGLLLWVTLGMQLVHPLFHSLNSHDTDHSTSAGHEIARATAPAGTDSPHAHSVASGGYAAESCPVCEFVANGGPWIGTSLSSPAQAIALASHPPPPDSRLLPARLLLAKRSRAPPLQSLRSPPDYRATLLRSPRSPHAVLLPAGRRHSQPDSIRRDHYAYDTNGRSLRPDSNAGNRPDPGRQSGRSHCAVAQRGKGAPGSAYPAADASRGARPPA